MNPLTTKSRLVAFLFGLWECRSDIGITYNDDPEDRLSRAYDRGRALGCKLLGLD